MAQKELMEKRVAKYDVIIGKLINRKISLEEKVLTWYKITLQSLFITKFILKTQKYVQFKNKYK